MQHFVLDYKPKEIGSFNVQSFHNNKRKEDIFVYFQNCDINVADGIHFCPFCRKFLISIRVSIRQIFERTLNACVPHRIAGTDCQV